MLDRSQSLDRAQSLHVWTTSGPHAYVPNLGAEDFVVNTFCFPQKTVMGQLWQQDRASRSFRVKRKDGSVDEEWSVDAELGSGTFGTAYLATSAVTGRRYVIKFLKNANDSELELLKSIPYEAFQHPNLCQYVGIADNISNVFPGEYKSMLFMDAIPNGELFDLLVSTKAINSAASSGFPEDTMRRFAHDIIKGMRYLAYHNITHGDLKPENLLIDERARVIIIDFGTAKQHTNFPLLCDHDVAPLLAHLDGMKLKELKRLAIEMGVRENTVEDADEKEDPKGAVIQMLSGLKEQHRLVCLIADTSGGTPGYRPPEHPWMTEEEVRNGCCNPDRHPLIDGLYDCERGDVFAVGLILCMMRWTKNPGDITNSGRAIIAEGLHPARWRTAMADSQRFTDEPLFSDELKHLVNAMIRKDPGLRPGWSELFLACKKESPLVSLKWLSYEPSTPSRFFQELKLHDPTIPKRLKCTGAFEALVTYVRSFEGGASAAFKEATTENDCRLSACQLHAAIHARPNCDTKVTELDLAALMCRFTENETMDLEQFVTLSTKWSGPDHEVKDMRGRSNSRYYAWKLPPDGMSAEEECQKFVQKIRDQAVDEKDEKASRGRTAELGCMNGLFACGTVLSTLWPTSSGTCGALTSSGTCGALCLCLCLGYNYLRIPGTPAPAGFLKFEPAPDEAKKKASEDGLFHECFTIMKDECQFRCNVFPMGSNIILETKLRFGSAVDQLDMLEEIFAAIDDKKVHRAKLPVVLTEEWLLPAMQEETITRVATVQQAENHAHVVLNDERGGKTIVEMVPNGEAVIILSEEEDSYKVKWRTTEGWAKKSDLVDVETLSAMTLSG